MFKTFQPTKLPSLGRLTLSDLALTSSPNSRSVGSPSNMVKWKKTSFSCSAVSMKPNVSLRVAMKPCRRGADGAVDPPDDEASDVDEQREYAAPPGKE